MERRSRKRTPEQDALEHIAACRDNPFLEARFINCFKGRGVFTHKTIEPCSFVVEYRGNLFCHKETRPETRCGDSLTGFLLEFSWNGAQWCIDASKEDNSLGRLVNDDHISPNCEMRTIVHEGKPHLCLFAVGEISPGVEITYSYWDYSCSWRSRVEDPAAFNSKKSCFDNDDELPGPSHTDSFANINTQLDFRDSSLFTELDSSLQLDDASSTQHEDESALSSDYHDSNGGHRSREDELKDEDASFTRRNYCYVCGKGYTKISRHLLSHANEEPDITEAFASPKNSKERRILLQKLRNRGNARHNQETAALKLRRQPKSTMTTRRYVHCKHCKATINRAELWRHVATCAEKTWDSAPGGRTEVLGEIALAESESSQKLPSDVWRMLLNMKQDEVAFVVQNDYLLVQLAQSLSEKYGSQPSKHDYIRQELREMGRLLLALHEKSVFSFEEAIKPENFDKVVDTVKNIAGFDEQQQFYSNPGLALKLGNSLKRLGSVVLAGADSDEMARNADTFMKLCAKEWTEVVSQTAAALLSGQKLNSTSTIPFTRDVQAFYRYLEKTSNVAIESMRKYESPQVYNALCRVTLAQASVINKCAPELSKMTLKSFQERDDTTQVLSKHFIRINMLSKAGQSVAVLLTSQLVSALTLLVSKRRACSVHEENPFLFAKPDSSPESLYHGGNCIRAFSSMCRAKNPEHLRLVHLHKHTARIFQFLNLENDELDHLANLLGHDIRADRDYYRLPEAAVELAKIAKLLLAMEKGSLDRFKGNSLEEIEIEDELEPDVERASTENMNADEDSEDSELLQQGDDVEQQGLQLTAVQDALEHIEGGRDKPFLEERFIDSFKGRGVFTHEAIEPCTFVVEYRGHMFPRIVTQKNKHEGALNDYLCDFSWNGTNWRIDASAEDGGLGRLVNDDHISPNCKMKKVVYEGKPHLCLFALKKISPGEEITYNYWGSSYPWRATGSTEELNTPQRDFQSFPEDERVEDSAEASSSAELFSDEEYVCDEELSSDDSFTSNKKKSSPKQPDGASSTQQEDMAPHNANESDRESEDYFLSKRNYCYVCGKPQTKISRHLFTHRTEEPDIAEAFALCRKSKERKKLLDTLRNRGNHKHAEEVPKTRSGERKVRKLDRSEPKMSATCVYCKRMFGRTTVWQHMQKCPSKKFSNPASGMTPILTLVAATGLMEPGEISAGVRNMLKKMKKDEVGSIVFKDPYILQLAECLYCMNENKQNGAETSQRLRQMGRLLVTLKKKSMRSIEDAIKPQNFSVVVEAVRELAGFNEEKKSCDRPTLACKLGNSLKKIADIQYARALNEEADKEAIQEAETFMKLCAKEWPSNHPAAPKVISTPAESFIQDVQFLYACLEKIVASAVQSLTMIESSPVFIALLRVTVAYVSVLNKNLAEVSKVTLQSFKERDEAEHQEDAAVCPSQFEQILSKHTVKISVVSKSGKNLVLTLTPELLSAITLLVNRRDTCGVHKDNPFLFGRPAAVCTSFCQGQQCINTFVARCGAKNQESLRSVFFRKHTKRIFQILSLTNDELDQLAKLLGRDIRTTREYYQTPEAAADIAKISELLSAMEDGSLGRFEGKSLEDIEIPDEFQPVEEQDSENGDAEEDNEESETSLQLSVCSSTRKSRRVSSSAKHGRGSSRKWKESDVEQTEQNDEEKDELNTGTGDKSEDMPGKCAASQADETTIYFNDNDDGADFDMDPDDDVRNVEIDADGGPKGSAAENEIADGNDVTTEGEDSSDRKREDVSHNENSTDRDREDTMDVDTENYLEGEEDEEQHDVDSSGSSATLSTENNNNLSAALAGFKEVKILIPKLDIVKLQAPVHISHESSLCSEQLVKEEPIFDDKNQCASPSAPTEDTNKPSYAKAVLVNCSQCSKSMMKGQTAYQKKGFTDVFCSKTCLFEMFPHSFFPRSKLPTKTCYYCLNAISQPLDLIMAAINNKGTMKNFCSPTCLCAFKSSIASIQAPPSVCSMCNKSCNTTCELTLNKAVHKFCSDACLENFSRNGMGVCENCSSTCRKKPLTLKLEDGTKTICSAACLKKFKEKITAPLQCTMCRYTQPVSNMVDYKNDEDTVKLFCGRACVTSYKLRPSVLYKSREKKSSARSKKKKDKHSKEKSNTEEVKDGSADASPAAEPDTAHILVAADVDTLCCKCGLTLLKGQTLYKLRSSEEVFCSASCLPGKQPLVQLPTKTCHNCCQVIMRPQNVILAPVDDSGTMRELCSNTCLSSVNSKINMAAVKPPPQEGPRSECRICNRYTYCKFKLTLDGILYRLCSDTCFISYHKVNNLPLSTCDICSSFCLDKRLVVNTGDHIKNICSDECVVKFKERLETCQLCPSCQTSHQMSDMVEYINSEGRLDFFCSNRCMVVHQAQSFTVLGESSPASEDDYIEEVKPLLPKLVSIKEEPIDEEDNQKLPASVSPQHIKNEPNVAKEALKIGSVFSLTGDSESAEPVLTNMDLPAPCSSCKKVLIDRETVYRRKDHADIFCSTPCLLKFYQKKPVKKTCHFCLQLITQPQDVLRAPVDDEGTKKEFCSQTCLSSFNYKRIMSTRMPVMPFASQCSMCSICSRYCISKHEIIQQDLIHKICSDPCFHRFCTMNNLFICKNCRSHCSTALTLKTEDSNTTLCSAECLAQFKQKIQTPQPCAMCHTCNKISDMVENKNSENVVELFCTSSCVMASKIQAVSASGAPLNCDNCSKTAVPACHIAMSDASIRNFCNLTCAMAYKGTQTHVTTATARAPRQSQSDFHQSPEKLPCAQCRRIIKNVPRVVQKKEKMNFVCGLACSQEFKRVNNITDTCEHCDSERIIHDVKRIDGKDCYFCSDGCKMLFHHELVKKWGQHCHSCAYCCSTSKTVVTAQGGDTNEEFCSEDCSSNYKMLLEDEAKCDACGLKGKLKRSLSLLGEVKHFCDLKCLLLFCTKKVQMFDTGTVKSFPVIMSATSLASALAGPPSASSSSTQLVSVADIETKVVGHASVQTDTKELKNKSTLCTPLVHNKGVSCAAQTVETEAQTDHLEPKVVVLPVPVPVYIPVPMNMYSQYTPKPVGLPLPLPVPVFLPVMLDSSETTTEAMKEKMQPDPFEGELNFRPEMEAEQDDGKEKEDRQKDAEVAEEEGQSLSVQDHTSSYSDDLDSDTDLFCDASLGSLSQPPAHKTPPPVVDMGMPSNHLPEVPPPAPPPPPQRDFSKVVSRKHLKLKTQCGVDAWKRWIRWRQAQTNLDPVSSRGVTLKANVLRCSAAELSDGLCRFINEVTQPDGKPYSPDSLFYLCLGIQKYLFVNGRLENIFSDHTYNKFSTEFTNILKHFRPSPMTGGYIHSCVEEEFLWGCKQLGAYSPIVLINTLLFFCCKYFGFTTVEQHRQLSFAHVTIYTKTNQNNTKTTFLRFYPPISLNEAESDTNTDGVPAKRRRKVEGEEGFLEMMENTDDPFRCPVTVYELYLSKCSESVRQRSDVFYLHPDHSCVPSSRLWFSVTPLDDAAMEAMLVRVLAIRDLQRENRGGTSMDPQTSEEEEEEEEEDSE